MQQAEKQMDRVVRAGVREIIARHTLAEVLTDQRSEIMGAIRKRVADSFADRITSYNVCYTKLLRCW